MNVTFRSYQRRDGSTMLYVNRSNGVSIGISPEQDFAPYGKTATPGKRNAYEAACLAIRQHGRPFTGDLSKHGETGFCAGVRLANGWTMVGTDVGNIGGLVVGGDGGYLVGFGLIVKMNNPLGESDAAEAMAS